MGGEARQIGRGEENTGELEGEGGAPARPGRIAIVLAAHYRAVSSSAGYQTIMRD